MACRGTQHGLRFSVTYLWPELEFGNLQPGEIPSFTMAVPELVVGAMSDTVPDALAARAVP